MENSRTVYIVHCIDTEGPLYESLIATFERLKDLFNVSISPSYENLRRLQNQEIDLNGKEGQVAEVLNPKLLDYNNSWEKIDAMLSKIMSLKFRNKLLDSDNKGWVYTWHCLDHVNFNINPRRRDMGFHNIHDRYLEFIDKYQSQMDSIEWHFHPMSTYKEAHRCATSYLNSPHLYETLCRRIIERNFFPSVFRAGFQTERPDSNWFLEQWIPFDASNMAIEAPEEFEKHNDFKYGRSGDWRRAPNDWSVYNPDLYDYQKPGKLRRYIGRFLNINTRIACINQNEVNQAFEKATHGPPVLMGMASHDWRNMEPEIDYVMSLIKKASDSFPDVKFIYSDAKNAFNQVIHDGKEEILQLKVDLFREDDIQRLKVETISSTVFGPQPFLAIKTKGNKFIHDNFDFGLDGKTWYYAFDNDTVPEKDVDQIGIAANNKYGNTFIQTLQVS